MKNSIEATPPTEWFRQWFNSPYYPIVYQHRDHTDAMLLLRLFLRYTQLPPGSRILDVGCGTGRHAILLAKQGYCVTGIDLSEFLLSIAKSAAGNSLPIHFLHHDMRTPLPDPPYDAVLNVFTSFGYFSSPEEDQSVLQNIADALEPGKFFFFDYLNAAYVTRTLRPVDFLKKGNLLIQQKRWIRDGKVWKEIIVSSPTGKSVQFFEQVRLYTLEQIKANFQDVGFKICYTFGDYQGNQYDRTNSPRIILLAQKL